MIHFFGFIKKYKSLSEQYWKGVKSFDDIHPSASKMLDQHVDYKYSHQHKGFEHLSKLRENVNATEQDHLSEYSDNSEAVNGFLIKHSPKPLQRARPFELYGGKKKYVGSMIKHISNVIKKHKTAKDMHLFTATKYSPEHAVNHNKGIIDLPAFTSTSLSKNKCRHFAARAMNSEHIYDTRTKERVGFKKFHELRRSTNKLKNKFYNGSINDKDYYNHPDVIKKSHCHEYEHMIRIHVPKGSHAVHVEPFSQYRSEREILLHKDARVHVHHEPEIDHENKQVIWHAKLLHDGVRPTSHMKNHE